jgi:hypothetical protein
MMLAPRVPVSVLVRMSPVRIVGTLTSAATSTCFVKKNGKFRANAVCTL